MTRSTRPCDVGNREGHFKQSLDKRHEKVVWLERGVCVTSTWEIKARLSDLIAPTGWAVVVATGWLFSHSGELRVTRLSISFILLSNTFYDCLKNQPSYETIWSIICSPNQEHLALQLAPITDPQKNPCLCVFVRRTDCEMMIWRRDVVSLSSTFV